MLKKRVIPILQINNDELVKSKTFCKHKYIGDPINAVRIFNQKEVDEIIIVDVFRSLKKSDDLNYNIIRDLADECRMPFSYGGGIKNIDQVKKLFQLGIEKIILGSGVIDNFKLIEDIAKNFGSQSVLISVDINKNFFNKKKIYNWVRKKNINYNIKEYISKCISSGAGELIINCVYKEGTLSGFDFSILDLIDPNIDIPVIVNGGTNSTNQINEVLRNSKVDGIAVGAFFVFYGPHNAVLISYNR